MIQIENNLIDIKFKNINDNIGNFENYNLKFSINYDSTDSFLYPTNGYINKISFLISPENISDTSFYKINITNKNYKKLEKSKISIIGIGGIGCPLATYLVSSGLKYIQLILSLGFLCSGIGSIAC